MAIGMILFLKGKSLTTLFGRNVDEIERYAWGVAMLATLHRSLEDHIKYGQVLYGNFHFVTVFIFKHILWVASRLLHPAIKKISIIFITEDLQNRPNFFSLLVEWTPYARLLGNFLPSPYDGQVALERALTSLISQEKGQKMLTMRDMGTFITTCSLLLGHDDLTGHQQQQMDHDDPFRHDDPMEQDQLIVSS
ncbi:hypothetical protein PVK06_024202 [Gossypium arboreum]|uniref:Serine/threonine-protein phosphatase 7 long form homolog n=1 Tax=Gossypium arboreum TaxID=29729 RepID=A0ABR0PD55_GOSAR|nr:hypothetical protein PVK06_024202 [Gossypium arboreum]